MGIIPPKEITTDGLESEKLFGPLYQAVRDLLPGLVCDPENPRKGWSPDRLPKGEAARQFVLTHWDAIWTMFITETEAGAAQTVLDLVNDQISRDPTNPMEVWDKLTEAACNMVMWDVTTSPPHRA